MALIQKSVKLGSLICFSAEEYVDTNLAMREVADVPEGNTDMPLAVE